VGIGSNLCPGSALIRWGTFVRQQRGRPPAILKYRTRAGEFVNSFKKTFRKPLSDATDEGAIQ